MWDPHWPTAEALCAGLVETGACKCPVPSNETGGSGEGETKYVRMFRSFWNESALGQSRAKFFRVPDYISINARWCVLP